MEAQRLEKELEDTGMKLSSVLSDITRATGRAILNALIGGERDPEALADLAIRRARRKIPALIEALDREFTEHHALMCRHFLDEIDHLTAVIDQLDRRIAALLTRLGRDEDIENLDSIPGIGPAGAQVIIAETGAGCPRCSGPTPTRTGDFISIWTAGSTSPGGRPNSDGLGAAYCPSP